MKNLLTLILFITLSSQSFALLKWQWDPSAQTSKVIQMKNELQKWSEQHKDLLKKAGLQEEIQKFTNGLGLKVGDPFDAGLEIDKAQKVLETLQNLPRIENLKALDESATGILAITRQTDIYDKLPKEVNGVPIVRTEGKYRPHALFGRRLDQYELERDYTIQWLDESQIRLGDVAQKSSQSLNKTSLWASKIELSALRAEQKLIALRNSVRLNDVKAQALANKDGHAYDVTRGNDEFRALENSGGYTVNNESGAYDSSNGGGEYGQYTAPSLVTGNGYSDAQTGVTVSETGVALIIEHEVGGQSYYNSRLKRPTYPGGASGVTVGIGYDLGYNTRDQIRKDWGGVIPDSTLNRLVAVAGFKRGSAKAKIGGMRDISIPFEAAKQVFHKRTMPRFTRMSQKAFPTMEKQHPHSQGALVSLVFNRGASMAGNRRRHMRQIREAILQGAPSKVPQIFRDMKVIWQGSGLDGLLRRRNDEGNLFQLGLSS